MNAVLSISPDQINSELIKNAKNNIDLLHIKDFIPSNTKWEEFISHCNFLEKNKQLTLSSPVKLIGALQIWDEFYLAEYYANQGDCFSQWKEITYKTDNLFGRENDGGCTLINFIGNQKQIPIHDDTRDSFYWQAIGNVEWQIYEKGNDSECLISFNVAPGDVLFVPKGIVHTVACSEPRAALSVFYDNR